MDAVFDSPDDVPEEVCPVLEELLGHVFSLRRFSLLLTMASTTLVQFALSLAYPQCHSFVSASSRVSQLST